jgi:hypothetical protein
MIRFDLDVISKLLVPVGQLAVAIAVGLISYSQWRVSVRQKEIAHNKIMLDLFDRRLKIYDSIVRSFASSQIPGVFDQENISFLREGIRGHEFLFGGELSKKIETLWSLAWRSTSINYYIDHCEEFEPIITDFKELSKPYLDVTNIRNHKT